MLKILEGSENYTCQVIKLPIMLPVKGLDNLVQVNYQGNSCLIGKDSDPDELYLFFPAECKINKYFLSGNNLFRHTELNIYKNQKGFFEDNCRVKAVKFKVVISTGFICPLDFLYEINMEDSMYKLKPGDEFNELDGILICEKYIKKPKTNSGIKTPRTSIIDSLIDSRFAPEHPSTSHLLKNTLLLNGVH